ncbi:hypothetical protein F5B20DRAFT_548362 [Whalleya microplaca]|nr:hypothetical protein F5B20DRAFT_548362 [Whalleya microplaca]
MPAATGNLHRVVVPILPYFIFVSFRGLPGLLLSVLWWSLRAAMLSNVALHRQAKGTAQRDSALQLFWCFWNWSHRLKVLQQQHRKLGIGSWKFRECLQTVSRCRKPSFLCTKL